MRQKNRDQQSPRTASGGICRERRAFVDVSLCCELLDRCSLGTAWDSRMALWLVREPVVEWGDGDAEVVAFVHRRVDRLAVATEVPIDTRPS